MTRFSTLHAMARAAWTLPLGKLAPLEAAGALGPPQLYWAREAEGLSVAGFGIAQTVGAETPAEGLLDALAADLEARRRAAPATRLPPLLWLGGLAFDSGRIGFPDPRWSGFGTARFQLPRLAVWREHGETHVTAFAGTEDEARAACERAHGVLTGPAVPWPRTEVRAVRLPADPAAWRELHARALAEIASGRMSKVVLARPVDVEGSLGGIRDVLSRLGADAAQGTLFAFQGAEDAWFVGLTPEVLVSVRDGCVRTEAIAGTARAGEGQRLLSSERILREQGAVVDAIREGLSPLCAQLELAEHPVPLRLRDVEHLQTPVRGRLREGVGLDAVVRALHPTPATGGTPRAAALPFLAEHEGFERGWYAGAVGGLGTMGLHLSVGLRSALLHAGGARLFVGAGVVEGSTAEAEWEETEAKARPMLRAVGLADG